MAWKKSKEIKKEKNNDNNQIVFIGDLEHSNILLNYKKKKEKKKDMIITNCRKVKFGAYEGG